MSEELFDRRLRALRRDRAARSGAELVLLDRAFDECVDRLRDIARGFDRALLIGAAAPEWCEKLGAIARSVEVVDPGAAFAVAAGGMCADEDGRGYGKERFDLVLAVGTLDTVNQLPLALRHIRSALRPDGVLMGALAGGDSLPALRGALIEADRASGGVSARVHPRIDPASLAALLASAGFVAPVVDVDRVTLRYPNLMRLVSDLRGMAATSILAKRAPYRGRAWLRRVEEAFAARGDEDGMIGERFDLLHFIGWTPAA